LLGDMLPVLKPCQTDKMLNCLILYLNGEIYTSLYSLDTRHLDPPQLGFHRPHDSPVGSREIALAGVGDSDTSATTEIRQTPKRV